MSYIAFELDAFDNAEHVARHAGASVDTVMAGLLRLWRHCWRQKTDVVAQEHLPGFFGINVGPGLAAFGFVEPVDAGYRVCGATRYLRIQKARSKGGKAASGNLKQNKKRTKTAEKPPKKASKSAENTENNENAPAQAGSEPDVSRTVSPAQAPADDRAFQRRATSELTTSLEPTVLKPELDPPPKLEPQKPDSEAARYGPLVGRLKASYLELIETAYVFGAECGRATKDLLKKGNDDEIDRRWRKGLTAGPYEAKCNTVLELSMRWNALAIDRGKPDKPDWLKKRNQEQAAKHVEGEFKL